MVETSIDGSVPECLCGCDGREREREKTGKSIKRCTILSRFVINENSKKMEVESVSSHAKRWNLLCAFKIFPELFFYFARFTVIRHTLELQENCEHGKYRVSQRCCSLIKLRRRRRRHVAFINAL